MRKLALVKDDAPNQDNKVEEFYWKPSNTASVR